MSRFFGKVLFWAGATSGCAMMLFSTGCASGGFQLTREYAQWVNSQSTILRVVLYILTSVVFAVTLLIDFVVNNTMDFWNGRVSQGTYQFKDQGKIFYAHHEIMPGTNLKRSTIRVEDMQNKLLQTVVLTETPNHEIELSVDGVVRARVQNISSLPRITSFDSRGKQTDRQVLWSLVSPAVLAAK